MSNNQTPETTADGGGGEFMLFGVRVVVDSMRKSVSLNNLSQYEHRIDAENVAGKVAGNISAGYTSADDAARHSSSAATTTAVNRERKRGMPWTEEEHKRFLVGLEKVGKGDWRGISRNFVKTRTPTQVASHAQKYFLRRSNINRRRRRSSLFDITTADSVVVNSTNDHMSKENIIGAESQQVAVASIQANPEMSNLKFTISSNSSAPIYNTLAPQVVTTPASSNKSMVDVDMNANTNTMFSIDPSPLSLNLSLSLSTEAAKATSSRNSTFQVMQGFSNSDGMISVV